MPRRTSDGFKSKNADVEKVFNSVITESILNRPSGPGRKKLPHTHGILASDEELAAFGRLDATK